MMKSILHVFSMVMLVMVLQACSTERESEETLTETDNETPFFNLKVGNLWVYKTFNRNNYTSEFQFGGKIDSVKIVDKVSLNGKEYFKTKQSWNQGSLSQSWLTYQRVNEKGYLVSLPSYFFDQGLTDEQYEFVSHPGEDFNYTYADETVAQYGNILWKRYPETSITVEGKEFTTSPFNGQFTPNEDYPTLIPKLVESHYAKGIGRVKRVNHTIVSHSNYEERLVSYVAGP